PSSARSWSGRSRAPSSLSVLPQPRGALLRSKTLLRLGLLAEQHHEEPHDGREEDERLLGRHEDAAEVLVLLRRDPPEPLGARRVVVVERRRERQCQTEERGADERRQHVADPAEG